MAEFVTLDEVSKLAEKLNPADKAALTAKLWRDSVQSIQGTPGRKWREIRGMVAFPYLLEDAQAWVTRTRREAEASREELWRRTP